MVPAAKARLSSEPVQVAGAENQGIADSAARDRLEQVARRYYAPLLSFFNKRTRNSLEVQDLVQQVFLRLAQHPGIERIGNPDAYIFQTASNALKDLHRRDVTRNRLLVQNLTHTREEDAIDAAFSPERVLLGREALNIVIVALRELPEKTRDVFMLRCFEGLKHAEIAKLYGISIRTVEKHAARALAHISRALE
jgi:RNA polymerase sigma-70 factor (ECF subfamily)